MRMASVMIGARANDQRNRNREHWQKAGLARRRRRRQIAPLLILAPIIKQHRRRTKIGLVINQHGPININDFFARRRRQVDKCFNDEAARRAQLAGRQHRQATTRVGRMGAMLIKMQIGQVGARRIALKRAAPE